MEALDIYDDYPRDMKKYLRNYGWNFNKKMFEFAVSLMKKLNPATGKQEKIEPMTKEQVDELLTKNNVKVENNVGYNMYYVANMAKADYYKSSIADEMHLALFVKDYIDDADNAGGNALRKFYADAVAKGIVIDWDDMV